MRARDGRMDDNIGREAILLGTIARVMPDPVFILDKHGVYREVIGGTERGLYGSGKHLVSNRLHDVFRTESADRFLETVRRAIDSGSLQTIEYELSQKDMKHVIEDGPAGPQWFEGRVIPFELLPEKEICVLWIAINITGKKLAEKERERVIEELKRASMEIKTLRGILPLCSHCKKIRDDKGYWKQVDEYIQHHSEADISHSVCPDCMKEFYSDFIETA